MHPSQRGAVMDRVPVPWPVRYERIALRMLASGLCVGGLCLVGLGCAQFRTSVALYGVPAQEYASAEGGASATITGILPAGYRQVNKLPAPVPDQAAPAPAPAQAPAALAMPESMQGPPVVPIGLDTVFRLAEEQNAQVGIARAKLQQACAQQDVASWRWLPDLYVGTSYYRHEGGIADENGFLVRSSFGSMFAGGEIAGHYDVKDIAYQQVNAQRQVWQQKGELSKVTMQTFLDASTTYIDWLT